METSDPGNDYWDELNTLGSVGPDGKRRIEPADLVDLARRRPEETAAAAQVFASDGLRHPGFAQRARALAAAHEEAFNDDSLSVVVAKVLADVGADHVELTYEGAPPPPKGWEVQVGHDMLDNLDTYVFVELFSHSRIGEGDPDPADRMRAMIGRCRITFPVPLSDPREVFEVPAVRRYVAQLNQQMPYLPVYLTPDPDEGMLYMWLACLAPQETVLDSGPALEHPDVVANAVQIARTTRLLAEMLNLDAQQTVDACFSALPSAYTALIQCLERELEDHAD